MKFDLGAILNLPELPKHMTEIQLALEQAIYCENTHIHEPAIRLARAPSKRLRSALVLAITDKVDKNVISACVSIELIHLASLVHDDIMDGASSRWGVKTVHEKEGLNRAILVGDYLFAKANQVAASVSLEAAELVATTIIALCDGQARELEDVGNVDRTIEAYLEAIEGKTGSLIAAACEIGGLCAGLDKPKLKALHNFGEAFGMSFQLIDDVLDFTSSPELLGKPTGNDVIEGVYTMPVILGLKGPNRKQLLSHLQNATKSQFVGTDLLKGDGSIAKTIEAAKKYNQHAAEFIKDFASKQLQSAPTAYTEWALKQLVSKTNV